AGTSPLIGGGFTPGGGGGPPVVTAGVPNVKAPAPSRKNSRFSGNDRLKRVRFTCASSASTCAKSVLYVTSAIRLLVTLYLTSTPASGLKSLLTTGGPTRSVVTREIAYGLTSRFRVVEGTSSPTI